MIDDLTNEQILVLIKRAEESFEDRGITRQILDTRLRFEDRFGKDSIALLDAYAMEEVSGHNDFLSGLVECFLQALSETGYLSEHGDDLLMIISKRLGMNVKLENISGIAGKDMQA